MELVWVNGKSCQLSSEDYLEEDNQGTKRTEKYIIQGSVGVYAVAIFYMEGLLWKQNKGRLVHRFNTTEHRLKNASCEFIKVQTKLVVMRIQRKL